MSKVGDLMQGFFMSSPKRMSWFLTSFPPKVIEKIGKKSAFSLVKEASEKIPAYKEFLSINKIKIDEIKNFEDIPVTTKSQYLKKFPLEKILLEPITEMDIIYRSSGNTGTPFWWPQLSSKDKTMPQYFDLYYNYLVNFDKYSTLVVNVLDMGVWVAGMTVASNLQRVSLAKNYKLTVMSPGSNIESALEIINRFGKLYDQVMIIGYPPFVECLILEGKKKGLDWKKLNVKVQIGGESFSERWRDKVIEELGVKDSDLLAVTSIFGSSDTGSGMTGFETAASILIKRLAVKDSKIRKKLFGDDRLPSLVQFVPMSSYVEEVNGNIVLTSRSGIPLLRYDIEDRGGVIPYEKMKEILSEFGHNLEELLKEYNQNVIWRLPFFYCFGRRNAVSIEGAHIYAEDIQTIIAEKELGDINNFKLTIKEFDDHAMHFTILLELKKDIKWGKEKIEEFKAKTQSIFRSGLIDISGDYKSAHKNNPKVCDPAIEIYHFAEGPFEADAGLAKQKHII